VLTPARIALVQESILRGDLALEEFELRRAYTLESSEKTTVVPVLLHPRTNSFFMFAGTGYLPNEINAPNANEWIIAIYSPGKTHPIERESSNSFDYHMGYFREWRDRVASHRRLPDVWAAASTEVLTPVVTPDNEPFTDDECEAITAAVYRIEDRLGELAGATSEMRAQLQAEANHISGQLKRLGKRDWARMFWGALFSQAFTAGLNALGVQQLFIYARDQLAGALSEMATHITGAFTNLPAP
jgi:hypothetical protein